MAVKLKENKMHTLSQHFNKLLKNISPPKERIHEAETIPGNIRDFLKKHESLKTTSPYTRLTGSYARKTYVGDIKDVDILVFVDEEYEDDSPESILRRLKRVLEDYEGHGEIEINHQRRSIHMFFENKYFHLDIVPAIIQESLDESLLIPDKGKKKWIATHPLGYKKLLSDLNQENFQKVIPLIRLMKHWCEIHMIYKKPKSYWMECLVFNKVTSGQVKMDKSLSEVFSDSVDLIYKGFEKHLEEKNTVPQIKDPKLGNNIAGNWKRSDFETFMSRLDEARKWAKKALEEDDKDKAIELWQKIFEEDYFPTSIDDDAKALADAIKTTEVSVTSLGIVTVGRTGSKSIEIPSHRFYGES